MAVAAHFYRQDNQPVYVLHTYPFKETSLVVELFSRAHGRVATVAKGARRPRSAMRGQLQAFQKLNATWSGKNELKSLHGLEWADALLVLQGEALMCGFYLNELLLRLLPREDAHTQLFDYYQITLRELSRSQHLATDLRRFELKLLQEMGYAVPLLQDETEAEIMADQTYCYEAEHGAAVFIRQRLNHKKMGVQLRGSTLIDMAHDNYSSPQTQQQSKQLMRYLLTHYLGDKPLHTRQLLIDLQGF